MRPTISEVLVEQAVLKLESNGVKPTLDAIRAELGNHGSKTTIVKHLRALKAKNTNSCSARSRMMSTFYIPDVRFRNNANSCSRSNYLVRLLGTLDKFGIPTSNPQMTEEIMAIFSELMEENLKYEHLLGAVRFFQQQLVESLK
ncbi:DNA-binding protein [Pseudomonas arsenicoxydans]|uniref:KfrA N-terminal DNA-binding domain-containing protein n=1 Tax=Pseudomonas arsenicoxydans TaxID=702115 RepID=A0A4P6G412_9PSED|nr:DNA-binding protein [Pseudomonas arsenicoxydans]QAY86169.1 hypothetical protein CUN61_20295 [Pseudomonas arsenicoxydans]